MEERVWHYVKRNHTTRIPRRHIFLDTESRWERKGNRRIQSWRLACATYRTAEKGRAAKESESDYVSPTQLWRDVSAFTKRRHRTVLWAHNLGFDVRISEAFQVLPKEGWRVVAHNLASRGTWIQWERDGASLLMVDSSSVFPTTLEQLGVAFGVAKLPLPAQDAPDSEWFARCRADTQILRDAVVAYLGWIEIQDLGNWQMTGAGQSYAAFRHKFMKHNLLVHADEEALAAERRAMWTGRCEAYWRGRTGHVGIEEWDLSLAYAVVARDFAVPTQLVGECRPDVDLQSLLSRPSTAVLAQVAVETDTPCVPTLVDGHIAWPTGRFVTTLWGPELALALENGATLTPQRVWLYRAAPALRDWALWIIHQLTSPDSEATPWQRIILKHWARACIGRFGMQYNRWEKFGATSDLRLRHTTVYDTRTGREFDLSHIGRDVHHSVGTVEWGNSQPAITGFVMSVSRVRLWHMHKAMPERSVLYADTDSFYITAEHHEAALALSRTPLGEGLRLKHTHRRIEIRGPRQLITDGTPKIAGLPHRAQTLPDGRFAGEVWQSLQASLTHGDPSTVVTADRVWAVRGIDRRRATGVDGWTVPLIVEGGVTVGPGPVQPRLSNPVATGQVPRLSRGIPRKRSARPDTAAHRPQSEPSSVTSLF